MLKYLVGLDTGTYSIVSPYMVVHAKTREKAAANYEKELNLVPGSGHVMALMTLFGPFNLDPVCTYGQCVKALKSAKELK